MRIFFRSLAWLLAGAVCVWAFFLYEPEQPPPGKTVVTFATWGGVAEKKAWLELIADFERKNPDIQIKLQLIPMKYTEKILALLAANIAPDVFTVNIADMVPKGVLLPIDDFLRADSSFHPEDFLPGTLELGKWQGRTYSITSALGPLVLFYNKRHFEEAGLPTPNELHARGEWNWGTFLRCCKALTVRDQDGHVVRWAYRSYAEWILWLYVSLNGGQPFSPDFRHANLTDPRTVEALQRAADLALVHKVSPELSPEEMTGMSPVWQDFKRGRVSMMHSGPWIVARLRGMQDPYDVAPPPAEPGGRSTANVSLATGIWSKCPHPKAAYRWLSYLWSRDARIIWSRLGFDIPALKELAERKELWIDPAIAPEHFDVFYQVAEEILKAPPSIMPLIPTEANMLIVRDVWQSIRLGRMSAAEALAAFQPRVQAILDETFGTH
ncbi:MAG: sugar ABC transporter substrate-binding protein [candidate division KSB1 bacterium]|nr:sugar ABC transporter substrate-binding protein [candidate division KSB1 bacterium]